MTRGKSYLPHLHAETLGIQVEYAHLSGQKGQYLPESGLIVLRRGLSMIAERCTLAHELQHVLAGDRRSKFGLVNARQEFRADRRAADLLICPEEYRAAERLCGGHAGALADQLDVTVHMLAVWQLKCLGALVGA